MRKQPITRYRAGLNLIEAVSGATCVDPHGLVTVLSQELVKAERPLAQKVVQ
jgi:hypothetical protein